MSAGLVERRELTVPLGLGPARAAVAAGLRDLGCRITSELTTRVEATRGSQLVGSMAQKQLPIAVLVTLQPVDAGTHVVIEVSDRWRTPTGTVFGMQSSYQRVFAEVLAGLGGRLQTGDGGVVDVPASAAPTGAQGLLDRANASLGSLTTKAISFADRKLQGAPTESAPAAWDAVEQVHLVVGESEVTLDDDETEAMLAVAAIVSAQPAGMPPTLVSHVERLAAAIEPVMASGSTHPVVQLAAPDAGAVTFLRQQAAVRESLPLRRLMTCRDCKFEKIVNDDFQRLQDRNRKLQAIVGGAGVTLRGGHISPFVVFGQLFRAKKLDPDFVCPRCQGMVADPIVLVLCPGCGRQHRGGGLRDCPCGYDFRARGAALLAEREQRRALPAAPAALSPPPAPDPALTPALRAPSSTPTSPPPVPGVPTAQPAAEQTVSLAPFAPGPVVASADGPGLALPLVTTSFAPTSAVPGGALDTPLHAGATPTDSPVPSGITGTAPEQPRSIPGATAEPAPAPAPAPVLSTAPQPAPGAPAATQPGAPQVVAPGWYADPWRQAAWRWWDGAQWTPHTSAGQPG